MSIENYEDSDGRTVRVTRTNSKMSTKNIVKNYEDMLATLLAKCVQKDMLVTQYNIIKYKLINKIVNA